MIYSTDCVPQCKFGECNTTIGECICPFGYAGSDCSLISMLFITIVCVRVCVGGGACVRVCVRACMCVCREGSRVFLLTCEFL